MDVESWIMRELDTPDPRNYYRIVPKHEHCLPRAEDRIGVD